MKVNLKNLIVLNAAIAGAVTSAAVIESLNSDEWGAKQVAGAIRNLRNNKLVSGNTDAFKVTAAGKRFAMTASAEVDTTPAPASQATVSAAEGKQHNRRTKMAKALTLFQRHQHQGRPVVLAKFQSQLDMTENGASTYFQLCRRELGISGRQSAAA